MAPSWIERNRVIGTWIPDGSSVVDIGAGSQNLRDFLPPGCRYQPVDVVPPDAHTLFADFNAYTVPVMERSADVVVCSGVLEYVIEGCRVSRAYTHRF